MSKVKAEFVFYVKKKAMASLRRKETAYSKKRQTLCRSGAYLLKRNTENGPTDCYVDHNIVNSAFTCRDSFRDSAMQVSEYYVKKRGKKRTEQMNLRARNRVVRRSETRFSRGEYRKVVGGYYD